MVHMGTVRAMGLVSRMLSINRRKKALTDDKIWLDRVEVLLRDTATLEDKAYRESTLHTYNLFKNENIMVITTLLCDFLMTAALGAFGIGLSYIYANINFDLTPSTIDQTKFLYMVIAPLFTIWNIAQYASFAIQTTGHIRPRNHMWALSHVGPSLLASNITAWLLMLLAVYCLPLNAMPVVLVHIPVLAVAILLGLWCKTFAKVGYVYGKYTIAKLAVRDDAFVDKYYALLNDFDEIEGVVCPFASVTKRTVARQAFGPTLCFLWTAVYTVGLGLLYQLNNSIVYKWFLFCLTIGIYILGNWLLQRFIAKSSGIMMYSKKMIVMFVYIYGMVACSQVRLVVTKFSGGHRIAASLIFACLSFSLRQFNSAKFKNQLFGFTEKGAEILQNIAIREEATPQRPADTPQRPAGISLEPFETLEPRPELPPVIAPGPKLSATPTTKNAGQFSSNSVVPVLKPHGAGEFAFEPQAPRVEPFTLPGQLARNEHEPPAHVQKAELAAAAVDEEIIPAAVQSTIGPFEEPARQVKRKKRVGTKRCNSLSARETRRRLSVNGQMLKPFIHLSRKSDQLCISVVASLITQNVCTILLAGLSCQLNQSDNTILSLGACPNGLFSQLLADLGPLLIFDVLEVLIFVKYYKIPTIHFFLQFDWFMVVAAMLVVYLNLVVVLWAVSPLL